MRKLLIATALLILGTAGTAAADHRRGDNYRQDRRERVVVRGNNHSRPVVRDRYVRDRYVSHRRPVYVNNGRYTFHNGRTFTYRQPIVNVRYTNYRYRPTLLVENYENQPGYLWVAGNWQWSGYEWTWVNGHYEVDANYGYNDASYGYNDSYANAPVSNGYEHDCD